MDIIEQLTRDESLRLTPYHDSVGKLTIGIGRNLDDCGISIEEANFLLQNDVEKVKRQLGAALPWTVKLDDARMGVLLNMAFNMGVNGLLSFHNTLASIETGDYTTAASQMLDSKWARQVGARATRLSEQMRTGQWT